MRDPGITRAIEAAGGVAALARKLGVTPGAISQWRLVPTERIGVVEAATGVPRNLLRPDLFATGSGFAEAQAPFVAEARALGLDPDAIAGQAVQAAISAEKARLWLEENRAAIEAQNAWIEEHGLPLAEYRMF